MAEREIQTLGRTNKNKLRAFFNDVYNLDLKSITQIKNVLGTDTDNETWEYLREEYNSEIIKKQNAKKVSRYQRARAKKVSQKFENVVKSNQSYFQKKQNVKENRKSTLISKFFQNYKKPINMEQRVKYNDPMLGIIFEKQFVDVYKIVPSEPVDIRSGTFIIFVREKLLPLLGNLHLRYKGGIIQIDLLGKWKDEDGTDSFDDSPIHKICIPAIVLTPRNYSVLMEEIFLHLKPPSSASYFQLE